MSACLLSGLFCMNERAMGRVMCAGQPLGFCLTFVFLMLFPFFLSWEIDFIFSFLVKSYE